MRKKMRKKSGKAFSTFPFEFLIVLTLDTERITMENCDLHKLV
jgi:hypothetical protein